MGTHTPTIDNIEHEAYGDEWWFGGSRGEGQTIITIDGQLWVTGGNQVETAKVIKQRVNGWDEQQAKIDELVKALEYAAAGNDELVAHIARRALTRAKGE